MNSRLLFHLESGQTVYRVEFDPATPEGEGRDLDKISVSKQSW